MQSINYDKNHFPINLDDYLPAMSSAQYRWILYQAGILQTEFAARLGRSKACLQYWWRSEQMKPRHVGYLRNYLGDNFFREYCKSYNRHLENGTLEEH